MKAAEREGRWKKRCSWIAELERLERKQAGGRDAAGTDEAVLYTERNQTGGSSLRRGFYVRREGHWGSVASEEKFGRLKQLMDTGKEKGYVLYDEVNELLTEDYPGGRELDDLLTELDTAGVEILEEPKIEFDKKLEEGEEPADLDLVQDFSDKTNDPVRMYLREMGTVPLLTREGEIELAKRIERGQAAVRKALSRSPLVIREILALAETLRKDPTTVRDILVMPDLVVTDENVAEQAEELLDDHRAKSKSTTRKPSNSGRNCRPSRAA